MKNQELWDKTVSILVKAYLNDTLEHDNCAACGIGNLICAANDFKLKEIGDKNYWVNNDIVVDPQSWYNFFGTSKVKKVKNKTLFNSGTKYFEVAHHLNIDNIKPKFKKILLNTGYSVFELAQLEHSFEFNDIARDDATRDERMFSGLMGMINKMSEIHEANPSEAKRAKELFVKELS